MDSRSIPKGQKETETREAGSLAQFTTTWNREGVYNYEPSMTIPDMSYTVQELLLNHTRGINSNVKNYDGEFLGEEVPQFDDITERIAYKNQLLEQIKELEQQEEDEKLTELQSQKEEPSSIEEQKNITSQ